ncbi:MAG: trypsin-like peptidase domain-containing protein [Gammaproteobacteria bacterium]|nr:trypsin-like peptidase domain-containing protein [Gammaproteobacteria bacterium]
MKKFAAIATLTLSLHSPYIFAQTVENLLPEERNSIQLFEKVSPLVVNVHRLQTVMTQSFETMDIQSGMASGFIWNKDGYIVTNFHVVQQGNKFAVTLQKGRTVTAKIVGAFPRKDIAVLKIEDAQTLKDLNTNGFEHFGIADSSKLKVGQKTFAIGNPFGLDRTLTSGIVSAVGREIPGIAGKIHNMIQTDASVNPGNSGGPLLDSNGQLIGMNTMIFSTTGNSAGIGFAVPSNDISRIVEALIKEGKIKQAGIGVQVFSDMIAESLNIKGVIVSTVMPGSAAKTAGLKGTYRDDEGNIHLGDIITEINSQPVKSYDDLNNVMEKVKIGETVTIKYVRDKKENKLNLKTQELN